MSLLWYLLLSGLAGFLAGKIIRGAGYGILADILLGIVGGWVGRWLGWHVFHFYFQYHYFVTALLGAILLVWIVRLIKRR
jgi:uncharacterized membrane protein YeaQ/YmgE (transglycosylase-associated protein family)